MNLFLAEFSKTLAPNDHAVLVLDGAGWHGSASQVVPDDITLMPLPPYSPDCNSVERIWLYLRERFLSLQLWPDQDAIIQACCDAWNGLVVDATGITSLYFYPWIISSAGRYERLIAALLVKKRHHLLNQAPCALISQGVGLGHDLTSLDGFARCCAGRDNFTSDVGQIAFKRLRYLLIPRFAEFGVFTVVDLGTKAFHPFLP